MERIRDKERDALIKRINRKLKAKGRILRVMHSRTANVGDYQLKTPYYVAAWPNNPDIEMQVCIDIYALGKELGVLAKSAAA